MPDAPRTATIADLDRVVHEPARLAILTVLSSCASADFTFLQTATGLTKGNLSVQITRLEEAGIVSVERVERGRRTVTLVSLTSTGGTRLRDYWRIMEDIRQHMRIGVADTEPEHGEAPGGIPEPVRG